jgi:hypothetical protein
LLIGGGCLTRRLGHGPGEPVRIGRKAEPLAERLLRGDDAKSADK